MGPGALAQVLRPLTTLTHPALLVGLQTSDDAAVYRLSDELALVQTLDFFPPVVDDPYTFGAIAAANAMSDIYAMGGEVLLGLNIAAWPEDLPGEMLGRIFAGGADKLAEVGAPIAGGHTVTDAEPKYGVCVTGTVHPDRVLTKAGARPGDRLYLTKPLGTGIVLTALKREAATGEDAAAAVASMTRLNRAAVRLAREAAGDGLHACTDITGFGLVGHAAEMAEKSGALLRLAVGLAPLLPGAREYAERGFVPGGIGRNRAHFAALGPDGVRLPAGLPRALDDLLHDPQTSGGLLLGVAADRAAALEAAFARDGEPLWPIGEVAAGRGVEVAR
jgi:selenide,water dikinase